MNTILSLIIIFLLSFLIYKKDHFFHYNTCTYNPSDLDNKTLQQCYEHCNDTTECDLTQCKKKCEECERCEFNLQNQMVNNLKPKPIILKGFSGNNCIKITWLQPYSDFQIHNYYIIVSDNINNLEIFKYQNSSSIIDFYIKNLKNDVLYEIIVLSKNDFGISEPSNIVSVLTNYKSTLNCGIEDLDNSELNNNLINNYNNNLNIYNSDNIEYEVKDILVKRLGISNINQNTKLFNINVY